VSKILLFTCFQNKEMVLLNYWIIQTDQKCKREKERKRERNKKATIMLIYIIKINILVLIGHLVLLSPFYTFYLSVSFQ